MLPRARAPGPPPPSGVFRFAPCRGALSAFTQLSWARASQARGVKAAAPPTSCTEPSYARGHQFCRCAATRPRRCASLPLGSRPGGWRALRLREQPLVGTEQPGNRAWLRPGGGSLPPRTRAACHRPTRPGRLRAQRQPLYALLLRWCRTTAAPPRRHGLLLAAGRWRARRSTTTW